MAKSKVNSASVVAVPVFRHAIRSAKVRTSHDGRFRVSRDEHGQWQLYDSVTQSLTTYATFHGTRVAIEAWMSRDGARFDVVPTWFGAAVLVERTTGRYWHHPDATSARQAMLDIIELESHLTVPNFFPS